MTDVKHLEICEDEEAQRNLRPKRTNFDHQQVYLDISDQEDDESIYDDENDISDSENLPDGKEDSAESTSSISATAGGGCIKRKRRITKDQRLAANKRERKRMLSLNSAFERLKKSVPVFPHERKLSRIQTLRLAMTYISFMTDLLWDTSFPSKHTNLVPMQQYHQPLPLQMSFGAGNPRHIGHHQHHQYTQHLQGQQVSCHGETGGVYLSY